MQQSSLLAAFSSWSEFAIVNKRNKLIVIRFAKRMMGNNLGKTFDFWYTFTMSRIRARHLTKLTFSRLLNGKKLSAFRIWTRFVDKVLEVERKNKQVSAM